MRQRDAARDKDTEWRKDVDHAIDDIKSRMTRDFSRLDKIEECLSDISRSIVRIETTLKMQAQLASQGTAK